MRRTFREWFDRLRVGTLKVRDTLRIGDAAAGNAAITGILQGTATWDAGNLVDGAGESKDVTVTGAALGDFAVASLGVDVVDLVVSASVVATNTVAIRIQNETGGAVDLASTTAKVLVIKTSANAI